jgi:hypothetical protein
VHLCHHLFNGPKGMYTSSDRNGSLNFIQLAWKSLARELTGWIIWTEWKKAASQRSKNVGKLRMQWTDQQQFQWAHTLKLMKFMYGKVFHVTGIRGINLWPSPLSSSFIINLGSLCLCIPSTWHIHLFLQTTILINNI